MKKLTKLFALLTLFFITLGSLSLATNAIAGSGRDCDSNAVIYCGTLTKTELNNKINKGTGKGNQSSAKLKALFKKFGYITSNSNHLKTGYVTKDGRVVLNDKVIARNVKSMGRHKLGHSTQVKGISYPLYLREPKYSFVSNSIPAYILLNYDGSFRMAILKSCGNIVPGTIRYPAATYNLNVIKWEDLDGDGVRDSGEPGIENWSFRIQGNGINQTRTTNASGTISLTDLNEGTYTVTEITQAGWTPTTPTVQTATLGPNRTLMFGNRRITAPERYTLGIVKWNDINGNARIDSNEPYLPNWSFRIEGNGLNEVRTTNASGLILRDDLGAGNYTVSEVSQDNWTATTETVQTATLGPNRTLYFGNREVTAERASLRIYKYEDQNGNRLQDNGEAMLSGWQFRVDGPNGYSELFTTDANGQILITNVAVGHYIVTETAREGWINTTGLRLEGDVEEGSVETFIFGNRRVGETPTPTPTPTPTGGPLPTSGPNDFANTIFASMSLSGGALAWLKSKKSLLKTLKG